MAATDMELGKQGSEALSGMSFTFKVQANTNGYFLRTSVMGGALAMGVESEDGELELGLCG